MTLHPEAQRLLAALDQAGLRPFEEGTVPTARAAATPAYIALQGDPAEVGSVVNLTMPGPAGEISLRIYTPAAKAPLPLVAYFHGGGWVLGDLDVADRPCRLLASAAGAIVVSVAYRLAPEHRYPAAFDDCYAATAWVAEHAAELGGDPCKLAVCGDSAGGNLAAAVALAARDRGGPALSAQLLLYPSLDFNFDTESYREYREGYGLTKTRMIWFWAHYLGARALNGDPYACPLRADSLAGLPPAYVATAEYDPLRDEGEAYASRLREAGVAITAKRFDGMLHGFLWTLAATPTAASVVDDLVAVLRASWS